LGGLVNYLKLDPLALLDGVMEDCWVGNGYFRQIKNKETCSNGANLDLIQLSTLGLLKVLQSKKND
jgi:hypothetical protein